MYFFLRMSSGSVGTSIPAPSQHILSSSAPFLPRHRTGLSNLAESTRRVLVFFFFCSKGTEYFSVPQGGNIASELAAFCRVQRVRNFLTFQLFQTCSFRQFKIKRVKKVIVIILTIFMFLNMWYKIISITFCTFYYTTYRIPFAATLSVQLSTGKGWFNTLSLSGGSNLKSKCTK